MAKLFDRATMKSAKEFPQALVEAVPYRIHTVLTDNGIQFADLPKNRNGATAMFREHPFDRVCWANRIEHRFTKPNHPWTNGQVEAYYYQTNEELQIHLDGFIAAYNFAKRLKTIHGLTPYEFIVKTWSETPDLFLQDPSHLNLGLYI